MIKTTSLNLLTSEYNQYFVITDEVERAVSESGIQEGIVTVITRHTTTGVTTNEALECLESDIKEFLGRLVPEDHPYAHARMLIVLNDNGMSISPSVGGFASYLAKVRMSSQYIIVGGDDMDVVTHGQHSACTVNLRCYQVVI